MKTKERKATRGRGGGDDPRQSRIGGIFLRDRRGLLKQRDLPLSNADGGSVLECNLVIEDY
jgi:hypothetical protein